MDFFLSAWFWVIEGIFCSLFFSALYYWFRERQIVMNWWKWALIMVWLLFFVFTILFVTTSLGENEPTAAFKGGLFFGVIAIISFIALWRILGLPGKKVNQLNKEQDL